MSKEDLIKHLGNNIRTGLYLFTGAGHSMGAEGISGQNLPSGKRLAQDLWKILYGDEEFDETLPLMDIYQAALKQHLRKVREYFKETFTISADTLPDWYEKYGNFPWKRVYTLNIDDLWSAMQRKFKLDLTMCEYSGLQSFDLMRFERENQCIIHLNGVLDDFPDKIIFSREDYAANITKEQPAYNLFTTDFINKTFIFVGSELDEAILWKYVVSRGEKRKLYQEREFRPKSFIIMPKLSKVRQANLIDYNIEWIQMSAEEFAEQVLTALKDLAHSEISRRTRAIEETFDLSIPHVHEIMNLPEKNAVAKRPFLLGREPYWSDILKNKSIERSVEAAWLTKLEKAIAEPENQGISRLFMLIGTAGNGQTTLSMRLAAQLASKGHQVGWLTIFEGDNISLTQRKLANISKLTCLFIDNCEILGRGMSKIFLDLVEKKKVHCLVLVGRSIKMNQEFEAVLSEKIQSETLRTPKLDDHDINALLDKLKEENQLGNLTNLPRDEQHHRFAERAEREFIVAMIEATQGDSFLVTICHEYQTLKEIETQIYCLIAVMTYIKLPIRKEEICLALDQEFAGNEVLGALENLRVEGLVIKRDDFFFLRHRTIADAVRSNLKSEGRLKYIYFQLARMAAIYRRNVEPQEARRIRRILTHCISHEVLADILKLNEAQENYEKIESYLNNDHHFWLQRGSLELERGALDIARSYLLTAQGIQPQDQLVKTALAYLKFKESWTFPNDGDSAKKEREAFYDLQDQIAERGERDRYPFFILGSQGLHYAQTCLKDPFERKKYLSELLDIVDKGVKIHRFEKSLADLRQRIQTAQLKTAVSN